MQKFAVNAFVFMLISSAAVAGEAARPNILFCIADDASYPHMSAYGCDWVSTPGFDQVAKQGLLFTNAYTPNAKCAPSRACILTGRNSWQLEAAANHWCYFPEKFKTYAESLSQHGYFVGKTAKGWAPGVAKDAGGNPREMAGKKFDNRRTKPPAKGISSNDYAGNFQEFMDARPSETPWCFWYGCTEPHRKYEYGVGIEKGGKSLGDIDKVPAYWPDNKVVRTDMLDYAYEIEHFDTHLERMLKLLDQRGELNNTIVVVTSDNGMPFPRVKGQEYETSNHLPLAIMWKDGIKRPGRQVDDYVSFIDFAPTFMEAARVAWNESGMQPTSGKSLFSVFNAQTTVASLHRDHVLIGKERHDIGRPNDNGYPIRGIIKNNMLLLQNFETARWPAGNPETGYLNTDGSPTKTEILNLRRSGSDRSFWKSAFGKRPAAGLFDVNSDPECMRNLALMPQHRALVEDLQNQLLRELKAEGDPRALGNGSVFDQYQYAEPGGRNFHQRFMKGEKLNASWVNKSDFETSAITDESEQTSDQVLAKKLIGSWRIVDANKDGTPSDAHYGVVTIKHITPTQFTWLSYTSSDRQVFRSMGGSWKIEDGNYVETALYGMHDDFRERKFGNVRALACDIQGDVFTQTAIAENGSKFIEVWHRIKPDEDPIAAEK